MRYFYQEIVTIVLIAGQSKWDPDNLHRHPDFAPIKKEPAADSSLRLPGPALSKREFATDMETSFIGVEDEYGSASADSSID